MNVEVCHRSKSITPSVIILTSLPIHLRVVMLCIMVQVTA